MIRKYDSCSFVPNGKKSWQKLDIFNKITVCSKLGILLQGEREHIKRFFLRLFGLTGESVFPYSQDFEAFLELAKPVFEDFCTNFER